MPSKSQSHQNPQADRDDSPGPQSMSCSSWWPHVLGKTDTTKNQEDHETKSHESEQDKNMLLPSERNLQNRYRKGSTHYGQLPNFACNASHYESTTPFNQIESSAKQKQGIRYHKLKTLASVHV